MHSCMELMTISFIFGVLAGAFLAAGFIFWSMEKADPHVIF